MWIEACEYENIAVKWLRYGRRAN